MIRITLDTRQMKRLMRKLEKYQQQPGRIVKDAMAEIVNVEKNHRNIVAAHKAHRTMAKKAKPPKIERAWMCGLLDAPRVDSLLALAAKSRKHRSNLARFLAANVNQKLQGKHTYDDQREKK